MTMWSYTDTRTTDDQKEFFSKNQNFWVLADKTNWAENFGSIWGIFGQTISTHFGAVNPLSMFSIIQPFIWDWDLYLILGRKELGI